MGSHAMKGVMFLVALAVVVLATRATADTQVKQNGRCDRHAVCGANHFCTAERHCSPCVDGKDKMTICNSRAAHAFDRPVDGSCNTCKEHEDEKKCDRHAVCGANHFCTAERHCSPCVDGKDKMAICNSRAAHAFDRP